MELDALSQKLPGEIYPILIDWTPELKGQSITSKVVESIDLTTGQAAAVAEDLGESSGILTVRVKGGIPGRSYKITARVTLTDGSVYEKDYRLDVVPNFPPYIIIEKQVAQILDLGIFFDDTLRGETIDTVQFMAVDESGNSVDIYTDRGRLEDLVSFRIQGGEQGKDYILNVIASTEEESVFIEQVLIRIRNQ